MTHHCGCGAGGLEPPCLPAHPSRLSGTPNLKTIKHMSKTAHHCVLGGLRDSDPDAHLPVCSRPCDPYSSSSHPSSSGTSPASSPLPWQCRQNITPPLHSMPPVPPHHGHMLLSPFISHLLVEVNLPALVHPRQQP